jgi:hypothetical protein
MFNHPEKFSVLLGSLNNEDLAALATSYKNLLDNLTTTDEPTAYYNYNFDTKSTKELIVSIIDDIETTIEQNKRHAEINKAVKEGRTTIPPDHWGVHETHCCERTGCKYGADDCPVAIGLTKQTYHCEFCTEDITCPLKKEHFIELEVQEEKKFKEKLALIMRENITFAP